MKYYCMDCGSIIHSSYDDGDYPEFSCCEKSKSVFTQDPKEALEELDAKMERIESNMDLIKEVIYTLENPDD